MITVRVRPITRELQVALDKALGPAARSKILANAAMRALAEAQSQNRSALGYVPPHRTFVDGRTGAPLESVKPEGTIAFRFQLVNDVVQTCLEELRKASPVLTGRYRRSHVIYADGQIVPAGSPIMAAREVVILNLVPYARKIERGLSQQAPNGVYEAVAAQMKRRFSNVAKIAFSYREPLAGDIALWAAQKERRLSRCGVRRSRSARQRDLRQPAIVITPY